jgi:asparaginyl-tRNA synthetase
MRSASVRDLFAGTVPVGSDVTLKGWVKTRRDSKQGFSFINLHDGSCFDAIQVVADKSLPNYEEEILHLTTGCAIVATGELVGSTGRGQSVEVHAKNIEVVGWVDDPETYPVSAKRHTFEHLREVLAQAVHRYMHDNGFAWIHTPIITASDCEGAGELFRVSTLDFANIPRDDQNNPDFSADFFGTEAFLTVSGQLNVESYCLALSKVYSFGPTFRAENSNTSRHLAEFWMIEPEIAFADLNDNADLAESFLKSIVKDVLEERADDMAFFAERIDKTLMPRLETLVQSEFARMDYTEAIETLKRADKKFDYPVEWGLDLQSEHERYLAEEHVGRPVVVMNYPQEIKAFYMRRNDDGKTVAAMDVLVPGAGEIVGGSQREERLDVLDKQLEKMGLSEQLWWYRDLRRYGTVPHAGFGLGFERLLLYITGMGNVRDLIPFPRTPKSAQF